MSNQKFILPDLGENIEGGDVVSISVKEGERIAENEVVCELETDKATIEVPSGLSGMVESVLVKVGDHVKVGEAVFEAVSESSSPEKVSEPVAPVAETPPVPTAEAPAGKGGKTTLTIPDMGGEEGAEADVIGISVSVGDAVKEGDPLLELETDKATIEVPAETDGKLAEWLVRSGDKVKTGIPFAVLETAAPASESADPAPAKPAVSEALAIHPSPLPPPSAPARTAASDQPFLKKTAAFIDLLSNERKLVPASPHVRRFAREIGVKIEEVVGTGINGRISEEDVKAHSKNLHLQREEGPKVVQATVSAGFEVPVLPDFTEWGEVEFEPMNKIKQVTAEHMAKAWNNIPHVTHFDKADVDHLEKLRKKHKATAEQHGAKLTMTAILLKASALVLKRFPRFNSSIDVRNRRLVLKRFVHVGVAVDTPNGLMVPVIRNADRKNVIELARDLGEISKKARERKVSPKDLQGGTFTISNLGGIGTLAFTPIVNWPEVAILGVAKSGLEPVFRDGGFVPRLMMPLSLSYDHRVIDGAEAARFLGTLVNYLEDPFLMNLLG